MNELPMKEQLRLNPEVRSKILASWEEIDRRSNNGLMTGTNKKVSNYAEQFRTMYPEEIQQEIPLENFAK